MAPLWSLIFVILFPAVTSSPNGHQDNTFQRHSQLPDFVLQKLQSISQWLDNKTDATIFDYIVLVNEGAGLNLFEGDIKGYNPKHRTAVRNRNLLWNTRVVPYVFDSSLDSSARKDIIDAIAEYHDKTCIRFVPRTTEKDFLNFKRISGCYSNVGRMGGEQSISLMRPCLKKGTAMHEMMHALGFWHEQSRPDRDSWVQIIYSNIQPGKSSNFAKLSVDEVDTLGVQYDYGSIMHYSKYAFSKNRNPTILPIRQTTLSMGQRTGFSQEDLQRINMLYRCDIPGPSLTTTTIRPIRPTPPQSTPRPPSTSHVVTHPGPIWVTHVPLGWTPWGVWSPCDLACHHTRYRFCLNYNPSFCPGATKETATCSMGCKSAVPLGCWKYDMSQSFVPSLENGHPSLTDPYKSRTEAVRKCADVAALSGYMVFALLDGGMCLSGMDAYRTYSKLGPSSKCGYRGLGSTEAISVYSFQKDINGQWSPWTVWGQCTRTCGGGVHYRYRRCDNPRPVGNGAHCRGSEIEQRPCNSNACPENSRCGVKFYTGTVGTSGLIFVDNYDNLMDCEYVIETSDPSLTISISIPSLDIEFSYGCIYDSLMIHDGRDSTSKILGSYCGKAPPADIQAGGNSLYIRFKSDETTTGKGFTIFYTINSRTRKACTQLPTPAHCTVFGSSNFVGDNVHFRCFSGYRLVGSSVITCMEQPNFAVWSDDVPYCLPSLKRHTTKFNSRMCTFEANMCGIIGDNTDDSDWIVVQTSNNTDDLKPYVDHTRGRHGHFLHTESTPFQSPGDVARGLSRSYAYDVRGHCITFWYRIFGGEMAVLNVYIHQHDDKNNITALTAEGDSNTEWKHAKVNVNTSRQFQIVFEAVVGDKFGSSFSLDDLMVTHGPC